MKLLSPYSFAGLELPNRMVMPAMTRSRALSGNIPGPLTVEYYTQRASAGLIVTEGSPVSPQAVGYVRTPGIYSEEQVNGWRAVVDAVHRAGGRIMLQLWHVGRASHPEFQGGELPVGPSAIAPEGNVYTSKGFQPIPTPRALRIEEMAGIVEQFRQAAAHAKAAGFDGVQLHGGNGYLLDQFVRDGSNKRTDAYGGSVEHRIRLPLEIAAAVIEEWGAERVGYKITPWSSMLSAFDSDPVSTFTCLVEALDALGIGFLEVVEREVGRPPGIAPIAPLIRRKFQRSLILGGGYDAQRAERTLQAGEADLIAFGAAYIANPDLPERFERQLPLNAPDTSTFYSGDARGYVDYPRLDSGDAEIQATARGS
ncbi:MAG TPA: alkene reductase [Steroidobacter sp.]|uniref:alkene reductase n=1 Tax=Steroidobacter sp. TaxID=1978227 RepID=UPI002EDB4559